MGVGFRATSGPVIAKSGDLAALLTNLEDGDVLFIDEIHRLNPAVEEILYPAMEDRALDLMIGEGPSARSVRIDLPRFTLVGATTRAGPAHHPAARPLRHPDPAQFLHRRGAGAGRPPRRAPAQCPDHRATARMKSPAAAAARRASPAACCAGCAISPMPRAPTAIDAAVADRALDRLEIDGLGLDAMDRRYLTMIADLYGGGPVGIETLAAGLSEPRDTLEDVIEPYLIQLGLIARTARGRCLNGRGWTHLGLDPARRRADRPVRSRRRSEMMRIPACSPRPSLPPPAAAQPARPPVDYAKPASWLCLPGRADICSTPLATTALNPNGYGSTGPSPVAKDPPIDCFYVYPTGQPRPGPQQRPQPRRREEKAAIAAQFARFAGVCRTFAPDYRQMTVGAVAAVAAGGDVTGPAAIAYRRRPRRLARLSRQPQPGPPVRPRSATARAR